MVRHAVALAVRPGTLGDVRGRPFAPAALPARPFTPEGTTP
ncbi:MAG: hypothetical protein WA890_19780 [Micromonospora sp.]